jgi:hypothetical protein
MSTDDVFVQEFQRLLQSIPNDISFRQLQYNYRQVAFLMGMKVLEKFPEILIGPRPGSLEAERMSEGSVGFHPAPPPRGAAGLGPGQSPGPYPHGLCPLICIILNA